MNLIELAESIKEMPAVQVAEITVQIGRSNKN